MPKDDKHYQLRWRRSICTCAVRRPLKAASSFCSCSNVWLRGRPSMLSWYMKILNKEIVVMFRTRSADERVLVFDRGGLH